MLTKQNGSRKGERKRVNFMINKAILAEIRTLVPSGEMSDFVNEALEKAMIQFSRIKASEGMDKLAEILSKKGVRMSTEEFIKLKNYGRE
jgi:hypothetical protein